MTGIFDEDICDEFYVMVGTSEFGRWVDTNEACLDEIMESILAMFRGVMPAEEVTMWCRALSIVSRKYAGLTEIEEERMKTLRSFYHELMILPYKCAETAKEIFRRIIPDRRIGLSIKRRRSFDDDLVAGVEVDY